MYLEERLNYSSAFLDQYFHYDPAVRTSVHGTGMDTVNLETCDGLVGIKNTQRTLRKIPVKLKNGELDWVVNNLGNLGINQEELLASITQHIGCSTNYFQKNSSLCKHAIEQAEQGTKCRLPKVDWNIFCEVNGEIAGGRYWADSRLIEVSYPKPETKDYLISLASCGRLPSGRVIFDHEVAHSIYRNNKDEKSVVPELDEVYAQRVGQNSINEWQKEDINLARFLFDSPLYPNFKDMTQLKSAVWFVDRFDSLGVGSLELMNLVRNPGRWLDNFGVWNEMTEVFGQIEKDMGMDPYDVEVALMQYKLQADIERIIAMHITQGILVEVGKPLISEYRRTTKNRNEYSDWISKWMKQGWTKSLLYLGNDWLVKK